MIKTYLGRCRNKLNTANPCRKSFGSPLTYLHIQGYLMPGKVNTQLNLNGGNKQ